MVEEFLHGKVEIEGRDKKGLWKGGECDNGEMGK